MKTRRHSNDKPKIYQHLGQYGDDLSVNDVDENVAWKLLTTL